MIEVFTDFDGTVTSQDSIVFLTERFGGGDAFRGNVLERIRSGEITVTRAIEEELATVGIPWEEAAAALRENIFVDPAFPGFVKWCRRAGIPVSVVSSGLKPVLELFIREMGVPFFAHDVEFRPDGWRYHKIGENEKLAILSRVPAESKIVYVGDGTSDFSVVPVVDVLFAKKYLAEHCREHSIPFLPFEDFQDVQHGLERIVSRLAASSS